MTTFADHTTFRLPDDRFRTYNLWDCVATVRAARVLHQELIDNHQAEFFERAVWPLVPAVLAMERRGLLCDTTARRSLQADLTAELTQLDKGLVEAAPELAKPTGSSPNSLNAGRKVASRLFRDPPEGFGLRPVKFTEASGEASVDQDALTRVLKNLRKKDEHARPWILDLFHRSKIKTILTRYMKFPIDEDGRVRPYIKMMGTETGRFAYDRPPLQQFPKSIRRVLVPAPGHVFIQADYSALEARISAHLSGDRMDIDLYSRGEDVHSATASELFLLDPARWDTYDQEFRTAARNYAKTFRYGILYGGDPETLKTKTFCPCHRCEGQAPSSLTLSREKIKEAAARWFRSHAPILQWREEISQQVARNRYLVNPFGRKRYFFTPWPKCKREAYNFPIQSTAADLINRAMREGHTRYALPFVLQMHDSLMVEVPEGDVPSATAQLREVMEEPVPEINHTSFPVDVEVQLEWGHAI